MSYWRRYHKNTDQDLARLPAHKIACPDCAQIVALPTLNTGQNAHCPTCNYKLVSIPTNPFLAPIIYSLTAILLMIYTCAFHFMGINMAGVGIYITIPQTFFVLLTQDFGFLADVLFVLLLGAPQIFLLLNLYIHHALLTQTKRPYLALSLRILLSLKPWMMVDVFLISVLVACVKIQEMASIEFGLSFFSLIAFALILVRTSLFVQPHWLHYQVKKLYHPNYQPIDTNTPLACTQCFFFNPLHLQKCTICTAPLQKRKHHSLQITLALLISAFILYFPANLYPMMITETIFNSLASTILEGVIILWQDGSEPIALIILIASIMIPTSKMIALCILLFSARFKLLGSPLYLTKLYRIVEFVGRWSMIDVFVVILMMTLIQTSVARIFPGSAVIYFCIVVILSMVSAIAFDVRLIWDKSQSENKI